VEKKRGGKKSKPSAFQPDFGVDPRREEEAHRIGKAHHLPRRRAIIGLLPATSAVCTCPADVGEEKTYYVR